MKFIIVVKDTSLAEHLISLFEYQGIDHADVTSSLESAKDKVSKKEVNCLIFDLEFCKEGYHSLIEYFCEPHMCFIPIKKDWNKEEAIEAINGGMAYILTYDCSKDKMNKCMTSVEARPYFPFNRNVFMKREGGSGCRYYF